jgi:hypothetical protein
MALTQAIKAEARRLRFQLAGVTLDPPPHFAVFRIGWRRAGGEIGYLAAERSRQRRDPRLILPECRSILVLVKVPAPERRPGRNK